MKAAIEEASWRGCSEKSRNIAVFGEMLELGKFSSEEHIKLFKLADSEPAGFDRIYAVGDLTKAGFDSLDPSKKGSWSKSAKEMFEILKRDLLNNDTVLIKGSFSTNVHQLVQNFKDLDITNSDQIIKEKIA
jgi:UDP-N-acetylmuramyl pentapeptide synthase